MAEQGRQLLAVVGVQVGHEGGPKAKISRAMLPFQTAAQGGYAPAVPVPCLDVRTGALLARLERLPERKEIPVICDEQQVVEFYSR